MSSVKLQTKILFFLLYVILFLGLLISIFGFFAVKKYIIGEAQRRVVNDLKIARLAYDQKLEFMRTSFDLIHETDDLENLRKKLGLDYMFWVTPQQAEKFSDDVIAQVIKEKMPFGATRIMSKEELRKLTGLSIRIEVKKTSKARFSDKKIVEDVMSLEYVRPVLDNSGKVKILLVGGKMINRNSEFIDSIVKAVFENVIYGGKPVGTVTVFQDDVRIATNVLDSQGQRAIGTRVSEVVYRKVVEEEGRWLDKAFVVTDWYITAYEPIRDIKGKIIGILYVGILEKPFIDLQKKLFLTLALIIGLTSLVIVGFSYFVTRAVSEPLVQVVKMANQISSGDLKSKVSEGHTNIEELNVLIEDFNKMSDRLVAREESLAFFNKQLAEMNRRYLDLIGFVSHELKGVLSSIILNTYLIQNSILGPINDKQAKTLRSMARNLDYLSVTVKNFLNLSRIEKDELNLTLNELLLKEHVFDGAVEAFLQQAEERGLKIINELQTGLVVLGDAGLLQIVANNLISNAIKYGEVNGEIHLLSRLKKGIIEIEVYNDGKPIAFVDVDKLFKKFSRVVYRGMESVKGTGIGLFITKEIIEKHKGKIWVEPREKGNSFIFQIAQMEKILIN